MNAFENTLNEQKQEITAMSITAKFNEVTEQDIKNLEDLIKTSKIKDSLKHFNSLDPSEKQKLVFINFKLSDEEIKFILENPVPGFSNHHNLKESLYALFLLTGNNRYNELTKSKKQYI